MYVCMSVFVRKDNIVCLATGYGKSIEIWFEIIPWCHVLRLLCMCTNKSGEVTCTINRIASATAAHMLNFVCLRVDPPSCTICVWVILRCELIIVIQARLSPVLSAYS